MSEGGGVANPGVSDEGKSLQLEEALNNETDNPETSTKTSTQVECNDKKSFVTANSPCVSPKNLFCWL